MAYHYQAGDNAAFDGLPPVTAEDVLDFFHGHVDPSDEAAIRENRGLLYRYANSPGLLRSLVTRALVEGHEANADGFMLTNQSIVVQSRGAYILRLNFWNAPSANELHNQREQDLLSYESPHDHNFSLLTIGCFGPGYKTTVRGYDRSAVRGDIGEVVDLGPVERYQLGKNDILFYSACRDIHAQHIPESLSISLNLIAQDFAVYRQSQYSVDFETGRITGYPESRIGKYLALLDLIGDEAEHYRDELLRIARESDSDLLRRKARRLLESSACDQPVAA